MSHKPRYIPKGAIKITDKHSDAIAYIYDRAGMPYALVFFGNQSKPFLHCPYRDAAKREQAIRDVFKRRQDMRTLKANWKAERKAKAIEFAAQVQIGDIFHYSFGYDETHHVYFEVVEVQGRHAIVRKIGQAQQSLGYDDRHRCMPQSGQFVGEPQRVLLQDGLIKVDRHYHASKWNTGRVAGVPIGPSYTGGGMH
jgi:hypothetical protein